MRRHVNLEYWMDSERIGAKSGEERERLEAAYKEYADRLEKVVNRKNVKRVVEAFSKVARFGKDVETYLGFLDGKSGEWITDGLLWCRNGKEVGYLLEAYRKYSDVLEGVADGDYPWPIVAGFNKLARKGKDVEKYLKNVRELGESARWYVWKVMFYENVTS